MRRGFIVLLLVSGCAGGQTGEITEPTACSEPVGTTAIDAPSEAGDAPGARLDALVTATERAVTIDGATTMLEVAFAPSGEPAVLLGGPECVRPWLDVPVTIAVRTADGALDETIDGVALLAVAEGATVRASLPLAEARGTIASEREASLVVSLQAGPDQLTGRFSIQTEDTSELELARF